jgi:hypothetical protein
LRVPPGLPAFSDVGAILFAGAHGFFEAYPLGGEEARQHRLVGLDPVRVKQPSPTAIRNS